MQERYTQLKEQNKCYELSFETIRDLILQAAQMRIKGLYLVGGEPFLRSDIFDIIALAKKEGMETTITTNGTLLDEKMIDSILRSQLSCLNISLDGASEGVYSSIRGGGILDRIRANTKELTRTKKARASVLPKVTFLCTVMNQNIEELAEVVSLAKGLGGDAISFQPVVVDNTDQRLADSHSPNWVPPEKYPVLDASLDRLIAFKLSNEENFNFLSSSLQQLRMIKRYFRQDPSLRVKKRCYLGFSRMIVTQDAKMYFCVEGPVAGETSFGDVRRDRLSDLWRSATARRFRVNMKRCQNPCLLSCSSRVEFDDFRKAIGNFFSKFF